MLCLQSIRVRKVQHQIKPAVVTQELESAFSVFNDFADRLSSSYRVLEERIARLNEELADARLERLAQLAEREKLANRLSHLLAALPAAVIVIDVKGVIQECNPAAVDFLKEPLQGQLWRDVIERAFKPSIQGGQEAALRDGRVVSISTCPLGSEPGQIILLVDVTETRALQQSVERYKRLSELGEMSAKLAHQIRTPLSSAVLYTAQLAKSGMREPARTRFAEKALAQLRHMEHVVEDMLAFTRGGGAGQAPMRIADLFDDVRQAMEPVAESQACILHVQKKFPDVSLFINRDAVRGVFQNLISNAFQVCGPGGQVVFGCREVEEHPGLPAVDLVVSDNGPGIAPELLERIFEPFFTTRTQGTGLGLAVARAVVQTHGGSLWVESSDAQGTTFVARLPLDRQAASEMTGDASFAESSQGQE